MRSFNLIVTGFVPFGPVITTDGNAVIRNRVKRRFRELARELLPEAGIAGADHVIIGRNSAVERDFAKLRSDLAKALAKVAE